MSRGARQATVHGVAKSWTWLSKHTCVTYYVSHEYIYWLFPKSRLKLWGTYEEIGQWVPGVWDSFRKQSIEVKFRFYSFTWYLSSCPLSWAISGKNSVPRNYAASTWGKVIWNHSFLFIYFIGYTWSHLWHTESLVMACKLLVETWGS